MKTKEPTAHTPGPWQVCRREPGQFTIEAFGGQHARSIIARLHEHELCEEHGESPDANACLIASAPELLDTLQALVDCYGMGLSPEKFIEQSRDFFADAKVIVAVATV